jgi:hypothetical protein
MCTRVRSGWRRSAPRSCSMSGRWPTTSRQSSGCCVVGRRCGVPTSLGFGLYRHLSSRASIAGAWRLGWCRSGRAIGSRPIRRMRASLRVRSRAGCWSRSVCPRPFRRPPVTWCAPARTRGWIGCPTGAAVEVLPALGAEAADERLDRRSPQVALRVAFPVRGAADHLRFLPPRGRSGRRADRAAGVAQLPTAPSHPGARPRRPGASDRAGP